MSSSRDIQVLRAIAEALNGASDVDAALQTTLAQVTRLLRLETGWIWLADEASGRYYGAAAQQLPAFLRKPIEMTGKSCWCLRAFAHGELEAGNVDVLECSRLRSAIAGGAGAETRGLRYHATIPLYFGTRPLGVMNVAAKAWRRLTVRELDLLSTIASQVGIAIERARLAASAANMARADERTRLARDLHDTLAQRLTAIALHLETAADALPANAAAQTPIKRALELSRGGVDDTRRSIRDLRGETARALGDTLAGIAHAFTAETGVRVQLRVDEIPALPAVVEQEMVSIAREALNNVGRHAAATDVDLSVVATPRATTLSVSDNGRGFDIRARHSGYGLVGMRERALAINARIRIASSRSGGTRVTVTLPHHDVAGSQARPRARRAAAPRRRVEE